MSIRTSFLFRWLLLILIAACSSDRVVSPSPQNLARRFSFTGPSTNGKIAFSSDRDYQFPSRVQIYTVNPDGTGLTRLTDNVEGVLYDSDYPAISADGKKIVFAGVLTGGAPWEIFTMNADGTGKTRLTFQDGFDYVPEWSPDGTMIAFSSQRSGQFELWVMDSVGGNLKQLTTNGMGGRSSWSRDGTRIIYAGLCGDPEEAGVCSVPPDGSSPPTRIISSGSGYIVDPTWSPDGTRILFVGKYNGLNAIWTINPDGTSEHPAIQVSGAVNPRWSPDGTKILYQLGSQFFLADADGQNQHAFTTEDIYGGVTADAYWGPAPAPPKQCADGSDNDSDGKTDYPADPGCSSATDDDETDPAPPPAACADGVDNDLDGKIDLADPGCSSVTDNDETDPPPTIYQCSDGVDNDGDRKIDFPADPGCSSATDNDETNTKRGGGGPTPKPPPQCADGIDNDGDGQIDLADAQCRNAKDDDERK